MSVAAQLEVAVPPPAPSFRRHVLRAAMVAALFIAAGVAVPWLVGSVLFMTLLAQAAISAIMAMGVGTLLRLNGVVSFGHAAFFGLAAYIIGLTLKQGWAGAEVAILLALAVPTLLAFLLGLGIVDIPGIAFSMLTLAVGQALNQFALKARDVSGGEDGFAIKLPAQVFGFQTSALQRPQVMFILCWAALVLIVLGLSVLTRSRFGRLVEAIRENEERARFIGFRTKVPRALVLALSGFIAAVGGVFFALYNAFVSPDVLHWSLSGSALIMVIIGGPKLVWGPAFGAILYFFFKDIVGDLTEHWQAMVGLTLIAVTVALPHGIGGALERRFALWRGRGAA